MLIKAIAAKHFILRISFCTEFRVSFILAWAGIFSCFFHQEMIVNAALDALTESSRRCARFWRINILQHTVFRSVFIWGGTAHLNCGCFPTVDSLWKCVLSFSPNWTLGYDSTSHRELLIKAWTWRLFLLGSVEVTVVVCAFAVPGAPWHHAMLDTDFWELRPLVVVVWGGHLPGQLLLTFNEGLFHRHSRHTECESACSLYRVNQWAKAVSNCVICWADCTVLGCTWCVMKSI